jgi:hypothetical protein
MNQNNNYNYPNGFINNNNNNVNNSQTFNQCMPLNNSVRSQMFPTNQQMPPHFMNTPSPGMNFHNYNNQYQQMPVYNQPQPGFYNRPPMYFNPYQPNFYQQPQQMNEQQFVQTMPISRSSNDRKKVFDYSDKPSCSSSSSSYNQKRSYSNYDRTNIKYRKYDNNNSRFKKRSRSRSRRRYRSKSRSRSNSRNVRSKKESSQNSKISSNESENNSTDDEKYSKIDTFTVQSTNIPIYYNKDKMNPKLIKSTTKLEELCSKFDDSILKRSRRVREKQGLPIESTQIPDYRQLLMTNKFDKFSRCKCDHKTEDNKPSKCAQHNRKSRNKQSKQNESDKSSSSSRNSSTSSSSSNSSSYSSSSFSSSNSKSSKTKIKKSKEKENDDEFEDIRSMEIDRKQKHPERLHSDLSFNEPDQVIFISVNHSKIYLINYIII